jgi:TPR repeat protein
MTTAAPWGNPKSDLPPPRPVLVLLAALLVLPVLGYAAGSFIERRALDDPNTRLKVAIEALENGYDATALRLFLSLAEKGNAKAQYHLAIMYEHGWGTPVDAQKAVDLYTKAAEQSLVPAETRLGEIYLRGTLVLQNLTKARAWSEKAAKAQSSDAELDLADFYERGLGVPADPIEAYAWYAVAAKQGNRLAVTQRDKVLETLSLNEQAKAEARAKALEASLKANVGGKQEPRIGTSRSASTPQR